MKRTWADFLNDAFLNPIDFVQSHWLWVIVILLILFMMARLNNYLDEKGVDYAIHIARGMTSTILMFVVAPIIVLIFINLVALIEGLPFLELWFLVDWLRLTMTTFIWLIKCALNSRSITFNPQMYDLNAIIRISWVTIPFVVAAIYQYQQYSYRTWLQTLLIPYVLCILWITQYRKSPEPFIKKYLPSFVLEMDSLETNKKHDFNKKITIIGKDTVHHQIDTKTTNIKKNTKTTQKEVPPPNIANVIIIGLFLLGLFLYFFTQYQNIAMMMAIGGMVMGVLLFSPPNPDAEKVTKIKNDAKRHLDTLLVDFEGFYQQTKGAESLELSQRAMNIRNLIKEYRLKLPTNFCDSIHYQKYFYEFCEIK